MNKSSKVVIPTVGSLGDVLPCILVGAELKKLNYRVTVAATRKYRQKIADYGLEWADIEGDIEYVMSETPEGQEVSRNPSIFKFNALKALFNPLVAKWFKAMQKACPDADFIIFTIPSLASGYSMVEANPHIKACVLNFYPNTPTKEFAAPMLGSSQSYFGFMNSLKWKMQDMGSWSIAKDTINQLRKELLNLPPTANFRSLMNTWAMPSITCFSQYLLPRPTDWASNEHMVGPIIMEFNIKKLDKVEKFLSAGEAPLFIGIGSTMSIMFDAAEQHEFISVWLEGLALVQRRAVINLQGFAEIDQFLALQPDRPNICFINEHVSHDWLLPQCRAFVHHGGAGTTHTGIRHGLPTLVLPVAADQPFNGDLIYRNSLGPAPIPMRKLNLKKFVNALRDLEKPIYTENAKKVAEKMKTENGLQSAVKIIMEYFKA